MTSSVLATRNVSVYVIGGGALVLTALLLWTRSVRQEDHVAVVSALEHVQSLDAKRNHEVLALRYGLTDQYDAIRELAAQIGEYSGTLATAPALLDTKEGAALASAVEQLEANLAEKSALVDAFISSNATLNNSIRCLPKSVNMLLEDSEVMLSEPLREGLDQLQANVFRYTLTSEIPLKSAAERSIENLSDLGRSLAPKLGTKLHAALFQAQLVVQDLGGVDEQVRAIQSMDINARLRETAQAYTHGYERIEGRVRSARWWLYGACVCLLGYIAFTIVRINRLNATIEHKVIERTRELEASREQFRSLVETSRTVPWQWDSTARCFTYVGPQAGPLLGCSCDDWLQAGFWEARVHPDDVAAVKQRMDARKTDDNLEVEFRLERDDGAWVWLRSIVSATDNGDGGQLQGFMFDITERRRMELELQQAQKLESVGRLAAGVAHEINTPIQFVSDSVHFIRESMTDLFGLVGKLQVVHRSVVDGQPSSEAAAVATEAEESADLPYLVENLPKALDRSLDGLGRVATIVRSMKEFAHPDQKEMTAVDLNRAITSTLTIAKNEYKYVAEVETDFGEIPAVICHGGDVNQAILNIVVNAAHAIGDVVEGTGNRGRIIVRTRSKGEDVVIEIEDTGGGIPEEVRAKIFDPFFTTKEVGKGTGQGLAIARSVVVEKHGGELYFETEMGKGTTFFMELPVDGRVRRGSKAAA